MADDQLGLPVEITEKAIQKQVKTNDVRGEQIKFWGTGGGQNVISKTKGFNENAETLCL